MSVSTFTCAKDSSCLPDAQWRCECLSHALLCSLNAERPGYWPQVHCTWQHCRSKSTSHGHTLPPHTSPPKASHWMPHCTSSPLPSSLGWPSGDPHHTPETIQVATLPQPCAHCGGRQPPTPTSPPRRRQHACSAPCRSQAALRRCRVGLGSGSWPWCGGSSMGPSSTSWVLKLCGACSTNQQLGPVVRWVAQPCGRGALRGHGHRWQPRQGGVL